MTDDNGSRKASVTSNLLKYLVLAVVVQTCLIGGYFALENYDMFADHIENVGQMIKTAASKNSAPSQRATFISLVRNSELEDLLKSISQIETTFNQQFQYPWTFFNDDEFSQEFMDQVNAAVSTSAEFVKILPEDWNEPSFINKTLAEQKGQEMKANGVRYADKQSYHRMCRWNSIEFFNNPALDKYRYYWRVEPGTKYFCDIDYDVFKYMEDNEMEYGFTINIYDSPLTVKSLWNVTMDFFDQNPQFLHQNNAYDWLVQSDRKETHNDLTNGYSTCHFWSNFEIGRVGFFRSEGYQKWVKYLDANGGFFYERWGDAPVHSLGLGLMADKSKIHYFDDIGYYHFPYYNCPDSDKCKGCEPGVFTQQNNLDKENCMKQWQRLVGSKRGLSNDD